MSDTKITWLSTKAAAEYLGITTRTLYRLVDEGQLPAYKFGRVLRLKQDDVDAFIDAARVQPGSLRHLYPDARKDADDPYTQTGDDPDDDEADDDDPRE